MVNTAELRQIFPLRENTLRHVVEGDGRYPRAMTPSDNGLCSVSMSFIGVYSSAYITHYVCHCLGTVVERY